MSNQTPMRELYSELINVSTTARHVQHKSTDATEVCLASIIEEKLVLIVMELAIEIPYLAGSLDFESGVEDERQNFIEK